MMFHRVDLYRPATEQTDIGQQFSNYSLVYESVPCCIQPSDSKEAFFLEERGIENMHSVYTTEVGNTYLRNDILDYQGRELHVVGVKNGVMLNQYIELTCVEYPEEAKKRLSRESY